MRHMNSVKVPATVIFSALLVIIMVSASRTNYTFATARSETESVHTTIVANAGQSSGVEGCTGRMTCVGDDGARKAEHDEHR
jgi:hypothetical protein